jgi:ABC-type multidrug transport system fused ATPase/permease subunit
MIEIFKLYMNNYYEKNKSTIIFFVIISLLFILFESVLVPYNIGKIINNIDKPMNYLYVLIGIYIIIYVLYYLKKKYESKIIPSLQTYSRSNLFSALIDKYSENYKSLKMGSTISKINSLTLFFKDFIINFIMMIFPNLIILLLLSIVILFQNTNLGLILFLSIILFIIIILLFKKSIFELKNKAENYYFNVTDNNLVDVYSSLMNTYLNNNETKEKDRIHNDQNIYNIYLTNISTEEGKLSCILYLISLLTIVICLFYIIHMKTNNQNKVLIIILLIYFINSLILLSKYIPFFLKVYSVLLNSKKYIKNILNNYNDENKKDILSGSLEFKNITFGYKQNNIILNKLNLVIKDKEKVALLGRSGSGKSTLSKLILKFYKYDGQIYIDNQDIKNINAKYLRKKVVYANQKTMLYDISVIDNIKYGNNAETDSIMKILNSYQLLELFNGLKDSIHSDSGVQGNELSGGMQKVVILLRSILKAEENNAYIIIFDEPLAGLDEKTRKKVIKLMNDKCSGKTLIIITHDKEILPFMDRVIDLSEINKF